MKSYPGHGKWQVLLNGITLTLDSISVIMNHLNVFISFW